MTTNGSWSQAIERMLARIQDTVGRVKEGFPHWADPETGRWTTTPDGDWTGGYWIGMLWLAAAAAGDARYAALAQPLAERLRPRIAAETVFKSFPAYYGAALGAILHDAPGPREIAIETARHLVRGMLFSTQSWLADRQREAWMAAAVRGADWWLAHAPADRVAFWDFDDPAIPNAERDTAATSIALAALLKLARVAPSEAERARYREAAEATARRSSSAI